MDKDLIEEFMTGYTGLASEEVMKVIYNLDWGSIHEWKNHDYNNSLVSDLIGILYENFWFGHKTEGLANDLILAAYEVIQEG